MEAVRIDDTGAPGDPYEDFLATGSPERFERPLADEEQTISINYTSGTTGRPKGVMYTHRGAYLNALMEALESHVRPDSVQLWVVPMFHCNGWCFTWAVTAMGARHVCLRKVDPAVIWELLEREGVTHFNGAPTVHLGLVTHPSAHRLEREVTVTIGGAPPSPTLLARMSALNFRPVHVYGLTETYAPYTVCERQEAWADLPDDERARRLGRQGVHNIVSDPIRVVDEQLRDVPRDGETMGEVVMRGNNVMKGYFAAPTRPRRRSRAVGFTPATSGSCTPTATSSSATAEGHHHLRRREHLHDRGREHDLPSPRRARVRGRSPSPTRGGASGRRPSSHSAQAQKASEQEIIAFCRDHLAHFKAPPQSRSASCPRPPPARSRNTCCANASGPDAPGASTDLRARLGRPKKEACRTTSNRQPLGRRSRALEGRAECRNPMDAGATSEPGRTLASRAKRN